MSKIYQVPAEDIKQVIWNGDHREYDYKLFQLGQGHEEFIIINPSFTTLNIQDKLGPIFNNSNRCNVYKYKNQWLAKYFNKHWDIERRYTEIDIDLKLEIEWRRNPELAIDIKFDQDPTTEPIKDLYDLNYEMIWYVDPKFVDSKIWAYRGQLKESSVLGTKDMGYISIPGSDQLDVIFISYNEPNAEKNWLRVLEKSPKAYRVNGITGIVNAHKCAAELATTDMFYVVDGDAYLTDDWRFEYQPSIFDRDCVHVWRSSNPVNGLEYGYGGVKLLPRQLTLNVDPNCVDMTTSISPRFKPMNKISNITAFNTDEFNTFRSAFRECAKLSSNILKRQLARESSKRLDIWCTVGNNNPFGEWAIKGANAGKQFGLTNQGNTVELQKINDSDWIQEQFNNLTR
jgi:hypothetical protein